MQHLRNLFRRINTRLSAAAIMVSMMVMSAIPAFAQEAPIAIEIPTGDLISYLNEWISVFAPIILFIGMIPVAIQLLRFLTNLFVSAFRGGGR